jgi:hypothetical protein
MRTRIPDWLNNLLPLIIILGLFTLALIWNIVAAFAILIVGLAIWLSRLVQRRQPREPGE